MAEASDYDLVIVGGGLVGISLACALGDRPLRIALVEALPFERNRTASYDDRTIALAYGARPIFEALGVWEALAPAVTPINRIHISERGRFGAARLDRDEMGTDALGYVVPSRVMGEALMERMAQFDNIELLCPARVERVVTDATGAEIGVSGEAGERSLRAKLLVVADGSHSGLRERLGIEVERRDYGQTALIANVTPTRHHDHIAYERFTDTGPMAMLPMGEGRCALVWTLRNDQVDEVAALDDGPFLVRLQQRFGNRLGRFERVGERSLHPLMQIVARQQVGERWALIGNAAHTLHPVAGQGFNLGLRDVAVLAEVVVDAVEQGGDIGEQAVLQHYAEWRHGDQRNIMGFTELLVRLFTHPLPPLKLARGAGLVALDLLPPARRWLTRQAMGLGGRLPRLARGLGGAAQ